MRNLLFVFASLMLLTSCFPNNYSDSSTKTKYVIGQVSVQIIVMDSCEYLYVQNAQSSLLTHKGNCKYCEQRHKLNGSN